MSKQKLLRRRTYLREYDYDKFILPKAHKIGYHRVEWHALTIDEMSSEIMFRVLKDTIKHCVLGFPYGRGHFDTGNTNEGIMALTYVEQLKIYNLLYDGTWDEWQWRYHHGGVELRYHSGHEWRPLGVATLERDY